MIAHRIIACRTQLGLTQAQLAQKLYITSSAEGNYEQGRRLPSVETLILMSDIFHVSLDYLIKGQEYTSIADATQPSADCPCRSCFWKDCK